MRVFSAVTVAIALCAAAPAFADAQSHVQAAKKAEKRGEWRKALQAWKAAYSADANAEYLIGIGDAYSHLGDKAEAKKNYEAYLADPLALPANVEKVKTKIAALESSGAALALPGGPGLALPGADAAAPPPLPALDLPAAEAKAKKGNKGKNGDAASPGLELPSQPTAVAANDKKADMLALPGLDLPAQPQPKKDEKKVATATPALELPGLPLPGVTAPPAKTDTGHKDQTTVASKDGATKATAKDTGKLVAITTPPKPPEHKVPDDALGSRPLHTQSEASSGPNRTVAYVMAGVAVVALGGGAFAYTKASSAHSDLTSHVHDGATAQSLLETEAKDKTLSFVGLAAGLVSAGIATALFAF